MVKRFMWPQARQNFCKLNNKIIFYITRIKLPGLALFSTIPKIVCFWVTIQYFSRACTCVCVAQ